ncbi:hypothetical protein [Streptomyces sp. MJP52]|uniref:hypothetical protein n=1 Tax=Streptomyces sp. MJP52 TaxID=2940555 RepID=UPI002473EDDC|nr:hypothetical protein [Streptomyces sp. MJP52]MDH6228893.1 hypothetical protein [Streptomyces sp. MJP52]
MTSEGARFSELEHLRWSKEAAARAKEEERAALAAVREAAANGLLSADNKPTAPPASAMVPAVEATALAAVAGEPTAPSLSEGNQGAVSSRRRGGTETRVVAGSARLSKTGRRPQDGP